MSTTARDEENLNIQEMEQDDELLSEEHARTQIEWMLRKACEDAKLRLVKKGLLIGDPADIIITRVED